MIAAGGKGHGKSDPCKASPQPHYLQLVKLNSALDNLQSFACLRLDSEANWKRDGLVSRI